MKELVDNSKLNDTIVAHIDSAVRCASQKVFLSAPSVTASVKATACRIGVIVLNERDQALRRGAHDA